MAAWIVGALGLWLLVAVAIATVVGRGIRMAGDGLSDPVLTTADLPEDFRPGRAADRR